MTLMLVVQGQPVPKKRPRVTRAGHAYTPKETVEHEAAVGWSMKAAWRREPSTEPFRVTLAFYMANNRPVDIDNLAKAVLDAGNGIVWVDDRQVRALSCTRDVDRSNPRTEITLEGLE